MERKIVQKDPTIIEIQNLLIKAEKLLISMDTPPTQVTTCNKIKDAITFIRDAMDLIGPLG